jgi:hypothetical protein
MCGVLAPLVYIGTEIRVTRRCTSSESDGSILRGSELISEPSAWMFLTASCGFGSAHTPITTA